MSQKLELEIQIIILSVALTHNNLRQCSCERDYKLIGFVYYFVIVL